MAIPSRKPQWSIRDLWHVLPWNGVFWLVAVLLVASATFFAVQAEIELARLMGLEEGETADIADGEAVTVVLILNGDELMVEKQGHRARVRMLAIRSFDPVVNEREITAYGHASVRFLQERLLNKQVTLHFDKPIRDVRGRYLAYVYQDDVDINKTMVENGISMVYTEFKTAREQVYLIAENLARRAQVGIWGGEKSHVRIRGLRRDWARTRQQQDGKPPVDPLLEEKP